MLHVVRYNRNQLPELIEQINASGYGLTLGVHTRIDETIARSLARPMLVTCMLTVIWWAQWWGATIRRRRVVRYRAESRRSALSLPSAGESPGKCAGGDARASGCRVSGRCAVESRIDSAAKCTAGMGWQIVQNCRRYVRNMASWRRQEHNDCCRGRRVNATPDAAAA